MIRFSALTAFLFGSIITMGSAQAATISFQDNLATVHKGATNVTLATLDFMKQKGEAVVDGYLPSDSEIVIKFTLTNAGPGPRSGSLSSYGSYDYTKGPIGNSTYYYGNSYSDTDGNHDSEGRTVHNGNLHDTQSLVTTLAFLNDDTGVATIINDGSSKAFFKTILTICQNLVGDITISYSVTSAVPLPASAPLFALALLVMLALGYKHKARIQKSFIG